MTAPKSTPPLTSFLDRLQHAGIEPGDSDDRRLSKSLLMLATGLISVAIILWVLLYSFLGPSFSSTLPFTFQILLAGNMLFYIKSRNYDFFRVSQLGLFLFLPFIAQWNGNIISTSGVLLWALLAPVGAILCVGVRKSIGWFIAWVVLTALSGATDYYLADVASMARLSAVPTQTTLVFFALNFISVSTIIYTLLALSIAERRKAQSSLKKAHAQILLEQERSEKLLLNILPGPIADRLKASDKTIADGFADVTVMFADIVNFTQVAANMSPSQVFAMLNRIFSAFDGLAEQYGLEKIKTIGDAYMIAGGLNDDVPDYTAAVADIALAMRNLLRRDFSINASQLEVRIGIGTGPIVAGVLGKKKFIYDLWGDTVNIASRITSEGVPGMIQCDVRTYHRLVSRFDFHEPQTLYLKGKGDMTVYRLIGRKGAAIDGDS
ncbi:MAG: adenylate/guanylate cyclase domain-containing protein [Burkholderiaceae bacterium]|nr:adenylate/guanylate cyclase domain-containing protein [Sulfuritalea sp.]MCF8176398.1 adenylate/guanylate cyclase domain-containing protein [Burkholderiaceae bacterium]